MLNRAPICSKYIQSAKKLLRPTCRNVCLDTVGCTCRRACANSTSVRMMQPCILAPGHEAKNDEASYPGS